MHIFRRELTSHRKSLIIWLISIILLLVASMAKYGTLASGGQAIQELLAQFPAAVQAIVGMDGLNIGTVSGYYGTVFSYLAVMAAIHAGLLGAELLSKEEIDKTTEFLYVKPISRARIISEKVIAGLALLLVINLVTLGASFASVAGFISVNEIARELLLFGAALGLIQLVFFSVGLCAAAVSTNSKLPSKLVAGYIFVAYILSVVIKLAPNLDILRVISPFMYFEAKHVLANNSLDGWYVTLSLLIVAIALPATYWFYTRRDLDV